MPRLVGYARVSTDDQQTRRQREELAAAGCGEIVEETRSGADRRRPALAKLLNQVGPGDTIVVVKLDRLARSVSHLWTIVETLEAKGAFLKVLGDPIDTTTSQGRLLLSILGAVAEFERNIIRERVMSGLASAARQGRRGGNPAIKARDPDALRRLQAASQDAYISKVAGTSVLWLPTVVRMREENRPWSAVVRTLNDPANQMVASTGAWTATRLRRAVKALARDGLVSSDVFGGRGRKNTKKDHTRDANIQTIAGMLQHQPRPTLKQIGERLVALRQYPPRGGKVWQASSIQRLIEAAERLGLAASANRPTPDIPPQKS